MGTCVNEAIWGQELFFYVIFVCPQRSVLNGLFLLYHPFLFEMDITDLKNGHVIPKFWVLENFSSILFITNDELALKQNLGLKS